MGPKKGKGKNNKSRSRTAAGADSTKTTVTLQTADKQQRASEQSEKNAACKTAAGANSVEELAALQTAEMQQMDSKESEKNKYRSYAAITAVKQDKNAEGGKKNKDHNGAALNADSVKKTLPLQTAGKLQKYSEQSVSQVFSQEKLEAQKCQSKGLGKACAQNKQFESALRPDHGKLGTCTKLVSNFYPLKYGNGDIYHYDVNISPVRSKGALKKGSSIQNFTNKSHVNSSETEAKEHSIVGKDMCRKILHGMMENKCLKKFKPVYDGGKNLYTYSRLPISEVVQFDVKLTENDRVKEFSVEIKPVVKVSSDNIISLRPLHDYFKGISQDLPEEVRMVFDTILRHRDPPFTQISPGRSFFSLNNNDDHHSVGNGWEVWLGYNQGIHFTEHGPALVVNIAASAFHKSGPVIEFASEILNKQITRDTYLSQKECVQLKRHLLNLSVESHHLGYKRRYKVKDLAKSARVETFYIDKDDKKVLTTVQKYFFDRFKMTLKFPNMPCLVMNTTRSKVCIPPEVVLIPPGQRIVGKLEGKLAEKTIQKATIQPSDRFRKIGENVQCIKSISSTYLKEFDLEQSVHPVELSARVIDQPIIQYKTIYLTPDKCKGDWNIRNCNFFKPASVNSWAIVNFVNSVTRLHLNALDDGYREAGQNSGLNLGKLILFEEAFNKTTEEIFYEISRKEESKISFIVVVISPNSSKHSYAEIKFLGDIVYHLITVCMTDCVVKKFNLQIASNECLKINRKLGGVNNKLRKTPSIFEKPAIIFGADVVHSPGTLNQSSIAALVGSLDPYLSNYSQSCCELINPNSGKQTQEIILELKDMVRKGLSAFHRENKCPPQKIIFYRDGVSEGQRQQVLEKEIPMVKAACREMGKNYNPPLTFVIVQKRHQARFATNGDNEKGNMLPGTVVDSVVTHPKYFDYYLCSHGSPRGTSRPAHYDVVFDENKFSSDEIEKLSFELCHVYARCNKSISIPAPIKYADLLAYRAKKYIDWQRGTGKPFDIKELLNKMETSRSCSMPYI